jgi:hypothetical protein
VKGGSGHDHHHERGRDVAEPSATFVLIMFATGITRSWELLGLRGGGPLDLLTESIANHGGRSPGEPHRGQQ